MGFDTFRKLYMEDHSFRKIFAKVSVGKHSDYIILNGDMFRGLQLCILDTRVAWKRSLWARQNFGLGLIRLLLAQAN